MFSKKILFVLMGFFLITAGLGCKGLSSSEQAAIKPVTLNYWRVYDGVDTFSEIINAYRALHPNITINYRVLRPEEFQTELLNALAEDRGPDMFTIQNNWMRAYQSKIYPLPRQTKVAYQTMEGTYQKTLVVNVQTAVTPTGKNIKDRYVETVADNVISTGLDPATNQSREMVYGLPLSVDTLALYYNKDLLDRAGIAEAPKTWEDFQKTIKKLTKINPDNTIVRSGAALGTGKNVLRSVDILSLLMMQNGTRMTNDAGYPTFHLIPPGSNLPVPPGEQALQFYTDFAQPTKEVYTWNATMPESLDAFVRGQTAFFFGYAYHLPFIRARAPKLNFNIVPVPQVNPQLPINFANFWVETVSKKTTHPDEAWDFILFAGNAKNVVNYLNKVKKPTALRELISSQAEDPDIGAFVSELLTAKSWYKGKDADLAEKYFVEMIDAVFLPDALNSPDVYNKAINTAAAKIGQTY